MIPLEYLAGYFDGEGCICVMQACGNTNRLQFRITIVSSDLEVLMAFDQRFGGGAREVRHGNSKKRMQLYRWSLNNQDAVNALRILLPHLIAKREQAEIASQSDWGDYRKNRSMFGWKDRRQELKQTLLAMKENRRITA